MTERSNQRGLPDGLLRSDAYPWRPDRIELVETHLSWVFLAGPRVVKVKRAVDFGFVDHRALDDRRRSCEAEVSLNRRLTTGVYLAAEPMTSGSAGLRLGGSGDIVEWATVMRRLPADRMLDKVLATGPIPTSTATTLADQLIAFHQTAPRCETSPWGSPQAQAEVLLENLDVLGGATGFLPPEQLAKVAAAVRTFLGNNLWTLERRGADGWVRDGHGDLRAEHICLESIDTIQVFDGVEFSPALRCADVASDLAYFLMDAERLNAPALATAVLDRYRTAGFNLPDDLVRLYKAHRALVRAKVNSLTAASSDEHQHWLMSDAVRYLDLATRAVVQLGPCLLVMSGLSGTGKSTVARRIASAFGLEVIQSDAVRLQLERQSHHTPDDRYASESVRNVYGALQERAEAGLAAGQPMLLDATFLDPDRRQEVAALAARHAVPMIFVETVCPESIVRERLRIRSEEGGTLSDATESVYLAQRAKFGGDRLSLPCGSMRVTIDTAPATGGSLDPLVGALERGGLLTSRLPV